MMQWLKRNGVIVLSFMLALSAEIVLLPESLVWFRPNFLLLVLIYWLLRLENKISIGIAFSLGILLDLLTGSILGEYALALTLITYFVVKYRSQIVVFSLVQQSAVVFIVTVLYLALIFWIQVALGHAPQTLLFCLPVLSNVILWLWFFPQLQRSRSKIGLY